MAYREWGGAAIDRSREDVWRSPGAVPSLVPAYPSGDTARPSLCPEIDCVRHLLDPQLVAAAETRAINLGIGADRVLVASGLIGEETYAAAFAEWSGLSYEPLFNTPRRLCPLFDEPLIETANAGMLPLDDGNGMRIVVAPSLVDSHRLINILGAGGDMATRIRITSAARLRGFVARHGAVEIEHRAVDELRVAHPEFSAGVSGSSRLRLLGYAAPVLALAAAAPGPMIVAIELFLGAVFLAWTALRVLGMVSERLLKRRRRNLDERSLPTYSVIVALYREAAAVPGLVAALRALDYTPEKLDIKLVIEPDDDETRDAIDALQLGPPFEVHVAPAGGPRTKPKALNAALPFVRGTFVAVFDAEDRPEPDQLRLALEAFVGGDARLACVQARLTIDNTADSWLTRLFTAEYAGLFDVFLPGLSAWRLPLPLGGSSNHFRTIELRKIGAWDPHNVTEDADLGMRLVRFGYRTAVINSTTYEEAPARLGPWLKQRTRWFKGWMQTWLVHMRSPLRLARELHAGGFLVFQLLMGGSVLAALVHVPFALRLAWMWGTAPEGDTILLSLVGFDGLTLMGGYLISAAVGVMGLARRNLLSSAWALLLIPIYWLLLSVAAWRALLQLPGKPYLWEKTEHGLARTSRLGAETQR